MTSQNGAPRSERARGNTGSSQNPEGVSKPETSSSSLQPSASAVSLVRPTLRTQMASDAAVAGVTVTWPVALQLVTAAHIPSSYVLPRTDWYCAELHSVFGVHWRSEVRVGRARS